MPEPSPTTNDRLIGVRAPDAASTAAIAAAVRTGLTATPKTLPPVLFYDRAGALLFEQICQCPEYYLTRTERGILQRHGHTIAGALPAEVTLIELGSGSAEKTEILLRALLATERAVRYVACDVAEGSLQRTEARLRRHLPALDVVPVLGDFEFALLQAPRLVRGACCWVFLGSSIGNFAPDSATAFLAGLRRRVAGHLLLGADMVKAASILHAAYDDAAGVTAAFNRNVLHRINRELHADFAVDRFAHAACYDTRRQCISMHLVSGAEQTVRIRSLGIEVGFARGETIHTEDSHKYTAVDLARMASAASFVPRRSFTDDDGWFTVALWAPA